MLISDFRFQISDWKAKLGRNFSNFVALAVIATVVMAPWAIRNQQVFGKPILTTTHGGYTLYLGNNQDFYRWLELRSPDVPWDSAEADWDLERIATLTVWIRGLAPKPVEVERDNLAYEQADKAISENKRMFIASCFYRIRQLWSPLPHKLTADESTGRMLLRYVTAAWYCGVYLLAAIGVWRLRGKLLRQPWVWGVLLCLTFTAVHTLYWCNLRMRAPLMPFVALVAAAGVSTIKRSNG